MNVLGLFGFGMNPGACLLRDGELVAFAEEERFTRQKTSPDLFPGHAVVYCLREAGLELSAVDRIGFAWDSSKYPYRMAASLGRQYLRYRGRAGGAGNGAGRSTLVSALVNVLKYGPGRLREEIRLGLRARGLRGEIPPVEFVPHHLAHAYSAYFCSPFEDAVVLTFDGSGEDVCTQVATGRGGRIEVTESIEIPHSLGWFYAAFTAYFGFTPYRHEGKLMALAAYGEERSGANPWPERLSAVLRVGDGSYEVDPTFTRLGGHSHAERFTDRLADWITGYDPALAPLPAADRSNGDAARPRYLEPGYVDLAWAVQRGLEEAARAVASRAVARTGLSDVCVAGGVGLNCKMNGALLRLPGVGRLFVQPACHDAGSAIGAAMVVAEAGGDDVRNRLANAYLGPGFSNAEIRSVLDRCGLRATEHDDVAARTAEELARGRVVGWFQDRMELGPRALGARSILADAGVPDVQERLNRRVKSREPWRPFCPTVLDEEKEACFESAAESPFMTTAFRVRGERREELCEAAHVDGSVRPQTLTAEASPRFHRLVSEVRARTGRPFVVNTSFNADGEPIVCTPLDAVRCFYSTGLDALAIGDFLLTK